jgi:enediyne biosynthesis protein E4
LRCFFTRNNEEERRPRSSGFRIVYRAVLLLALCTPSCGLRHRSNPTMSPTPADSAVAPPHTRLAFTDVAQESGLHFTLGHGGRSPLNILETAGHGCAFLDVDGDDRLDILLVGRPRCALYRNLGAPPGSSPRFEEITAAAGLAIKGYWMGCATGDYDNDGRVDLLLTGYHGAVLLHNEGGRFRDVSAGIPLPREAWNTSAAFLDADGDGLLDLYIGAYVHFGPHTLQLCDFSGIRAACPPTYYDAERGRLLRNLGGGRFADITHAAGLDAAHGKTLGVAVADYDGDGRIDLYLANDGMPGDLFHNLGGKFVDVGLESGTAFNHESREQAGMGVDWGDYDGDGLLDLLVTTFQYEPTSLYHNEGHGLFTEEGYAAGIGDASLSRLGFGARLFDADNDGDLELITANGHVQDNAARIFPGVTYAQPVQLFENLGERRFLDVSAAAGASLAKPIVGRGLAVGDYDNDGDLDVLIANLEGPPLLLRNDTPSTAHALTVRLQGRTAPRDGTGARLTLRAGGRRQLREAGTGGSYLSAGDPRIHFGLGAAAAADSLTIRWPSGATETRAHVAAGNLTLIEMSSHGH